MKDATVVSPRRAFVAGALALAALAGGCSVLPNTPNVSLYTLQPEPSTSAATSAATPVAAPGSRVDWRLTVSRPYASEPVNNPRIAVVPRTGELEVYPQAQWADTPPRLIGSLIIDDLIRSGRILGIDRSGAGLGADFELATTLRTFQVEIRDGAAVAVVRLRARLIAHPANRIVASQMFEASAPAASQQVSAAVRAFDTALGDVLPRLTAWTFDEGQRQWATRPPDGAVRPAK